VVFNLVVTFPYQLFIVPQKSAYPQGLVEEEIEALDREWDLQTQQLIALKAKDQVRAAALT
jgi:hypothetical protein